MAKIFEPEEIDSLYPGQVTGLPYSDLCILKEKIRFSISELEWKEPERGEAAEWRKWKNRMSIMESMQQAVEDAMLYAE